MPDDLRDMPESFDSRPMPDELRASHAAMASIDSAPPKAALVNLHTNEEHLFQFNPQTFEETIEAKYNRSQVNGLSHERLGYKNTGNDVIPIELYLSQFLQDQMVKQANSAPTLLERKAWLQSLLYPASNEDYGYAGPPQVLFIWPGVLRLVGKVMKISFLHREFSNRTLKTIRLVAKLTFEEEVPERRLMEDVQLNGSLWADEEL